MYSEDRNKYNANFYEQDKYYNTNQNNTDETNLDNTNDKKNSKLGSNDDNVEFGSDDYPGRDSKIKFNETRASDYKYNDVRTNKFNRKIETSAEFELYDSLFRNQMINMK